MDYIKKKHFDKSKFLQVYIFVGFKSFTCSHFDRLPFLPVYILTD